jgi:3',5'-nucleoside bisphosphate phosphatase
MDLDLHIHSTASDGTAAPREIVEAALEARLDAIAVTDHDTVIGLEPAREAVAGRPLEVIAAMEVSTTEDGAELHILGYFLDPEHPRVREYEGVAARRREDRMQEMVDRLHEEGVVVSFQEVTEAAGADRGNLGRPHLARALVKSGHVDSVSEAFDRFIGNEHPSYVPTRLLTPEQGIRLILDAGGVPVWAHPRDDELDRFLPGLVRAGLRGLEVYRPRTPRHRVLELERRARKAGLLVSGGSDWHGEEDGPLGEFRVSSDEVGRLLEEGGL